MELLPEFLERTRLGHGGHCSPEVTIKVGGIFYLPLIIDKPLETPIDVDLSVQAPEGCMSCYGHRHSRTAHAVFFAGSSAGAAAKLWVAELVVAAESNHKSIGEVSVRVELSTGWVASQ